MLKALVAGFVLGFIVAYNMRIESVTSGDLQPY